MEVAQQMKKIRAKEPEAENLACWIKVESKEAAAQPGIPEPLEVRIGSCVVSVPPSFDKVSLAEVCKVLLSL